MTSEYNDSMVEELKTFFVPRSGNTENTLLKVVNGVVNGAHFEFANAQAAIDFADTNGYFHVYFPAGTYDNISITTNNLTVVSANNRATLFSATSGHGIEVDADYVQINNVAINGTPGGGNSWDALHVTSGSIRCRFYNISILSSDRYGGYCDGDQNVFNGFFFNAAGTDSDDFRFDTNSSENVIDSSVNLDGTYTDNGAGNIKGDVT